MRASQSAFVRQQGYDQNHPPDLYSALMFQPKVVGVLLVVGMAIQNATFFLALGAALGWAALVPTHNLFNWMYDVVVAMPRGGRRLGPAPPPRRFAMGLAGATAFGISAAIVTGAPLVAWSLEGFLLLAVLAILVGRFCFGSFVYYQLTRWLPGDRRPQHVCWR